MHKKALNMILKLLTLACWVPMSSLQPQAVGTEACMMAFRARRCRSTALSAARKSRRTFTALATCSSVSRSASCSQASQKSKWRHVLRRERGEKGREHPAATGPPISDRPSAMHTSAKARLGGFPQCTHRDFAQRLTRGWQTGGGSKTCTL